MYIWLSFYIWRARKKEKKFEVQFECLGENTDLLVAIKKELDNGLCQPHYQKCLIIYLKFIAKNVEIKAENLRLSLKSLKIINLLIIAKNLKETVKINK